MAEICENIETINQRVATACENAGRSPDDVQLIAVSKTKPLDDIETAVGCGQLHFGENRARELQDKMDTYANPDVQWHMVGNLQTNKIKYMVERVNWIHSIEKPKYLREIEKRAGRINRTINTLVQVNISGEDQKSGCTPDQIQPMLDTARPMEHVRVRGLMGMASFTDDMDVVRDQFKQLNDLFHRHREQNEGGVQMEHLSMGMTADLEVAIEEGSTMIRVGRAIFGERNYD